ncbi:hypothetical protein QA596_12205 [Balneolales bacterium ANBcel1]|nr:hypothetical protein [Balneolales bacterium ANBcel1]
MGFWDNLDSQEYREELVKDIWRNLIRDPSYPYGGNDDGYTPDDK